MVCPICLQKTEVINSRQQWRQLSVWRRRRCLGCQQRFSSIERPQLETLMVVVKNDGQKTPVSETAILLAVAEAIGQPDKKGELIKATNQTCLTKILSQKSNQISLKDLEKIIYQTLAGVDQKAAWRYISRPETSLELSEVASIKKKSLS